MALITIRVDHYHHFDSEPCRELVVSAGHPERIPIVSKPLVVKFSANERVPLKADSAIDTDGGHLSLPNPVSYSSADGALTFTPGTDDAGNTVTWMQSTNKKSGTFQAIASDGVVTDKQIIATAVVAEDDINIEAGTPVPIPEVPAAA